MKYAPNGKERLSKRESSVLFVRRSNAHRTELSRLKASALLTSSTDHASRHAARLRAASRQRDSGMRAQLHATLPPLLDLIQPPRRARARARVCFLLFFTATFTHVAGCIDEKGENSRPRASVPAPRSGSATAGSTTVTRVTLLLLLCAGELYYDRTLHANQGERRRGEI